MRTWSNVEKPIRHISDGITIVITLPKSLNLPENEFSFLNNKLNLIYLKLSYLHLLNYIITICCYVTLYLSLFSDDYCVYIENSLKKEPYF